MSATLVTLGTIATLAYLVFVHITTDEYANLRWRSRNQYKAERARTAKWEALYVEYLGYGFAPGESRAKANAKLNAEAKAADEVLRGKSC